MTFCGGQCYGTQSDTSGAFAIPIGTFLPTEDYAMHADGRPDHAVDYLRFTANEPSVISATMHLPTLPPSTVQLPPDGSPASSVTVGDLTLLIPDNTMFDLDIEDFQDDDRADRPRCVRAARGRARGVRHPGQRRCDHRRSRRPGRRHVPTSRLENSPLCRWAFR